MITLNHSKVRTMDLHHSSRSKGDMPFDKPFQNKGDLMIRNTMPCESAGAQLWAVPVPSTGGTSGTVHHVH